MDRRDFLKSMAATGVAASVAGTVGPLRGTAQAAKKADIGQVQSVKVDVLTETSWFDNDIFKKNLMDYGGAMTNQYTIPWEWNNAGGYSALVTVTGLDGKERKFLMDTGWNTEWMDYIFSEKSNVAAMLKSGEIEFMMLSHWHLDHLWGIESTLKHKPDITIYAPKTHYPEDIALLREKAHHKAKTQDGKEVLICKNDVPHTGKLVECVPEGDKGDGVYRLMPGVAVRMFDCTDSPACAWRKCAVFQCEGQGRSNGHRLLSSGGLVTVFLGANEYRRIQAVRLLRRSSHHPV